jgi:hypothetical protein
MEEMVDYMLCQLLEFLDVSGARISDMRSLANT